ncbi:MAG: PspC domain-containing protein [Actinomycetia bacterium]|nr:PspC domain-containing protein [Actinomycetes bacterium]MCP5035500.1 PspC domain-containing protein [Actinomycetes bacterium]
MTTPVPVPQSRWQIPRIDPRDRWIGGVAAAIGREIGVQPTVIRVAFAILALAGGWGLVLYAVIWVALAIGQPRRISPYRPVPKGDSSVHRHLAIAMIVLGILLSLRGLAAGFVDQLVFPFLFVVTGFLIAWTRHRAPDDLIEGTGGSGLSAVARIMAGVVVGVGGMIGFIVMSADLIDAVLILLVAIAVIGGIGLVATPSLARIGQDLDHERQERVRADERARVAAHLHDSVLQTLALIQRHAQDPVRTAQLARQQERELRTWLYHKPSSQSEAGMSRLGTVLDEMGAEVDAAHGVPVKIITVGDNHDLPTASIEPLVAATREAAVNAAKHAETKRVDVFAERLDGRIEIFVRDTGNGFDPDDTAADRKGIAESIVGRMSRAGGTATVHSQPGHGTEVELVMPITDEREQS